MTLARRGDNEETTPLLLRNVTETDPERPTKTKLIYSYVFGFVFLLLFYVYSIRETLPTPLSDSEAKKINDFPGIHCYNEYLSHFITPHSANQKGNLEIKNWIVDLAHEFQEEATKNGVEMEIIANDPTDLVANINKFSKDEYWMVESRNVIIRLVGKSGNKNESFLVNAHYDSVSTSNGVTDNGMGTSVAIELMRYFVQHPPQHTVIFLFNNFEEGGLIGADSFVNHPWWPTIKLFVNLEGTGAGGRALLFRSNTLAAVHGLASSEARFLHASPLGNDLLQAHLLKSDTDYTVFAKHGVPGLDIAFYYPRSHYHTQRDDLAHTTPQSLQHMGQMALGSVLGIDKSENILHEAGAPEPIIYYDIVGRFMLVYSFFTCQLINILSLVLVPIALFTWFWFSQSSASEHYSSDSSAVNLEEKKILLKDKIWFIAQGLIATLVALVFMTAFVALSSWITLTVNPSATYGDMPNIVFYLTISAFLGLVVSQFALVRWSRSFRINLANMQVGFYGLTAFWWIVLAFATYLGSKKIAGIYFAIYFFISSTVATVIIANTTTIVSNLEDNDVNEVVVKDSKYWFIALLAQTILPITLMAEFLLLIMDSMRHTSADGTPEAAIYFLISVPIILIVLHLLPWIHAAGELYKTILCTSGLFVILFLFSVLSNPFNGNSSPNRIVFHQDYNASSALATVGLITGSSFGLLQRTLKQVLPASEYETMECNPWMTYQTRCTYQTELTPLYARSPKKEIYIDFTKTVCNTRTCNVKLSTTVKNSLLCQLQFSKNLTGLEAWVNGNHIKTTANGTIHALTAYTSKEASTVTWDIAFDSIQKVGFEDDAQDLDFGQVLFTCFYDDWINGELPAFTTLRDNLPINELLTIKGGVGLSTVHYYPAISL